MRIRAPLLLTLAVAGALAACSSPADRPQPQTMAATGRRLQVRLEPVADEKVIAATVEMRDQAEARARIGGVLAVLSVRAGDRVRRGQVIGQVVDQRLNFQTSAADAQVASVAAEAARAEAELGRATYLYDNGVYAKARLEQVQAQAKASQGTLAAARAQRAASADLAGQGAIRAPSDGRVLKADVPAGSVVAPGQSVATLTAGPPVLRVEIPEAEARALKLGQAVAIFPEDLQGLASGAITQIYPAVAVGRVVADITVSGLHPELIGQRVRTRLSVGQRRALLVPRSYVAHRYGLDFARVVGRTGEAMDVAVQLAPSGASDRVEILSGLADGDVIVPAAA